MFFWLAYAVFLGSGLTLANNAWSAELKSPPENVTPKKDYLVSAILRDAVEGRPIQLAHLTQTAGSADEATGIFTRMVLQKYPGQAISRTLTKELSLPSHTCPTGKQDAPAEKNTTGTYAISVVIRKGTEGFDFELLNGWMGGNRADEALNRALDSVAREYPHHTPFRTLITELNVARPACSTPGPVRGQWREA